MGNEGEEEEEEEEEVDTGEGGRGLCPLNLQDFAPFKDCKRGAGGGVMWSRAISGSGTGHDPPLLLLLPAN